MECLWLIPLISLLHCQATQIPPLDRASLSASNLSSTTSNASTVSATLTLNLITNTPVFSKISRNGAATSGLVTILKTIELIPQPVSGNSSARPNPAGDLVNPSMLQPIIVGGITYAPENAADHASISDGLERVASRLWQGKAGLPPVIVGGLTYTQVAKGLQSGMLPTGPMSVATAATETGKLAAISLMKGSESHLAHSISMRTQYLVGSGASRSVLSQSESLTLSTSSFAAVSRQLIIPASPSVFVIASQTFTAYPSGLAIADTEVFQGSTAITVSGTTISLGRSDIVIGTSTVPFASITGLGAALSSGLVPIVSSAPGAGSGPIAKATSAKESHQSSGGESGRKVGMVMVWLVIIAVFIAMR